MYQDAADFQGLPRGLDSVNRLSFLCLIARPALRPQVERLFCNAVSDASCSFIHPVDGEVSTDDATSHDAERLGAIKVRQQYVEVARSSHDFARATQRCEELATMRVAAYARTAAADEGTAAGAYLEEEGYEVPAAEATDTDDNLHSAVQQSAFPTIVAGATTVASHGPFP